MSAGYSQTKLWNQLTDKIIASDLLADKLKEAFDSGTAKRRWLSLMRQFKIYFYESLKTKATVNLDEFVYFRKMNLMFSEYAIQQLRMIDQENEELEITSVDVSRYLVNLLEGNQTLMECESVEFSENEREDNLDFVKKFTSMPRKSISVFETKLKVVPNTPFNRNFQVNSVYKRISVLNSRNSSINKLADSQNWNVEALDDSVLEIDESCNSSIQSLSTINDSFIGEIKSIQDISSSVRKTYQKSKISNRKDQNSVEFESILEVPTINDTTADELRCEQPSRNSNKFVIPTTMNRKRYTPNSTPVEIVPKRLMWDESCVQQDSDLKFDDKETGPRWFQQFMFRYNEDMMRIDTQLQSISNRICKIENNMCSE